MFIIIIIYSGVVEYDLAHYRGVVLVTILSQSCNGVFSGSLESRPMFESPNQEIITRLTYAALSGRIGKLVASHLRLKDRFPIELRLHRFILCTRRSGSTAHEGGGCVQSIGSTVSDAIVRCLLWTTGARSCPLDTSVALLRAVDNWPHIQW